jgi:DNA-binding response OmpR family regulator
MNRLLVCGDAGSTYRTVVDHLQELGHAVESVQDATAFVRDGEWDAIVVCHQTFDESLSLCRGLRMRGAGTIMLISEATRADYLRVRVPARADAPENASLERDGCETMRDPPSGARHRLQHGQLSVDLLLHRADVGGEEVQLTPIQFRLLSYLLANCGRAVSKEELRQNVFRTAELCESSKVRVHLCALRKRLGPIGACIAWDRRGGWGIDIKSDEGAVP